MVSVKYNNEKILVPKRFWNCTKSKIWNIWKNKYPNIKIAQSTFYKVLKTKCTNIKNCKRKTDICNICFNEKYIQLKLKNLSNMSSDEYHVFQQKLENIHVHKQFNKYQKTQFKLQKKKFK